MNTALPRIVVPSCTKPGFGFSSRLFRFMTCLALCALFMAAPGLAPSAQAADLYVLGGGGGGGGAQSSSLNNEGAGGGGGGAGAYVGNANPNGSGGDGGNNAWSSSGRGSGGSGGVSGTAGSDSTNSSGAAGGNGGIGSGTGAGNGDNGGQGEDNTDGNQEGGAGGAGGSAVATLSGSYDTVLIQGGDGGDAGGVNPGLRNGGDGGNGGSASLAATNLDASVSLSVISGLNGSNTETDNQNGAGGAASLTVTGTMIAPTINLTKKDGALSFNVTNLEIGSAFDTSLTATGLGAGDANISNLLLTGDKNFTLTGANVSVGQLHIDGGTLNNTNWTSLVGGDITYSTTDDITLLVGGATVDLGTGEDKTLGRELTGTGSLTKTGAGTLILTADNSYTGGTAVNAGTLQLGDGGITGGVGGDISLANNSALVFNHSGTTNYNHDISGTGSLTQAGTGTLVLGTTNTYTGMTVVRSGTLALGSTSGIENSAGLALYGGATFDFFSLSTSPPPAALKNLSVYGQGAAIAANTDGADFSNGTLNFFIPTTAGNGATMLTVTGAANITDSTVNVGIAGGSSPLQVGNQVVLIDATTLTGDPANSTANGRGMQGVTLLYEFDILADSLNSQLLAIVTATGASPQMKSLSEGRAANLAFVGQGADLILGPGMGAMLAATQGPGQGQGQGPGVSGTGASGSGTSGSGALAPFVAASGGTSRYNTGSHVDVDGFSLMAGLAWRQPLNDKGSNVLAGAFFEAGRGNYTSHNSFSSAASVKGDGDTSYYGGGVLARYGAACGGYADVSFRAGRASSDFSSSDMRDMAGRKADYDSSAAYYGAHAGLGYVWRITDKASLDLSTRYIWTHQGSDTVSVLGDPVTFKASDSHRWRTGARFAYAVNEYIAPYAGAYYDHEFDGKAKASTNGYAIDAPDLTGGTGVGEIGFTLTPSQNLPLSFDLGVQGYTGVREGVTGSLQVKWEF